MSHRRPVGCLLCGTLFVFAGCEAEVETAPAPQVFAAPPPTAPAVARATPIEGAAAPIWSYSPVGKRDPFRSYLAELKQNEKSGQAPKFEETEIFELDQYRLTGLVTGTAQPSAMVEDPNGKGHVLHIGTKLGKNGGRVTRVTGEGMVVTEEIRSPTGERVRVPITIPLPKPEIGLIEEQ